MKNPADFKILIACEESQTVCKAFRKRGFEAYSCDIIEPSGGHPEWHIKGDAIEALYSQKWDLVIAHPPCTFISNAGANHLWRGHKLNEERFKKGMEAVSFFRKFIEYGEAGGKIAIENPVPSKIFGLPKYSQIVQPYYFGDAFTKKTCLWNFNIENLVPTNVVSVDGVKTCHDAGSWFNVGGKDRQKNRAKTFPGIAAAMAEQWGNALLEEK